MTTAQLPRRFKQTCPQSGLRLTQATAGHLTWRVVVSSRRPLDVLAHQVTPSGWVEHHPDGSDEVAPWGEDPA